ncbi:hypothetical protein [Streptomyces sp. VRA16 Mangrove soil]|uniref:hypothetical protein n=1 Tax=Streptomyces sp. VRA16 Mangrove soil TaxID=2817434 RepID=UPI001A9D0271|nr:hypothetical protein [Streptomyces sp. VRA16 Mangrove soil]MBO1329894.1 hypothetical protein [Streptomyces sp. VRA16 Mangrove soil]
MPEVDELLDDVTLSLPDAATLRARGARRTGRRRVLVAGGAAAAVLAGVVWAVPGGGERQEAGPAHAPGQQVSESAATFPASTPYRKNGTIVLGPAKGLPRDGSRHWVRTDKGAAEEDWPLAWVGFGSAACGPDILPKEKASPGEHRGDSWNYTGSGGAVARQVYLEYTTPYDRMTDLSDLINSLTVCGLTADGAAGAEPSQVFKGSDPERPGLTVWVEHGWKWIRVVQEQSNRTSAS